MSSTRSKLVQYIREVVPDALGISSDYFSSKVNSFETDSRIKFLLGYKGKDAVTKIPIFDPFPPLLFTDFVQNEDVCFLNEAFAKVSCIDIMDLSIKSLLNAFRLAAA